MSNYTLIITWHDFGNTQPDGRDAPPDKQCRCVNAFVIGPSNPRLADYMDMVSVIRGTFPNLKDTDCDLGVVSDPDSRYYRRSLVRALVASGPPPGLPIAGVDVVDPPAQYHPLPEGWMVERSGQSSLRWL